MPALSFAEVDLAEHSLGVELPGLYRRLLTEIGPGASTRRPASTLAGSRALRPVLRRPVAIVPSLLPFGCHHGKQEMWIIDAAAERAASIWHETVPDDWPEEEWLEYDEWVVAI